jgi:hypothetical protein
MFYLSVFAVGVPKQVGDISLPLVMFGDGGDVNGSSVGAHAERFSRAGEKAQPPLWGTGSGYSLLTSRIRSQDMILVEKETDSGYI